MSSLTSDEETAKLVAWHIKNPGNKLEECEDCGAMTPGLRKCESCFQKMITRFKHKLEDNDE